MSLFMILTPPSSVPCPREIRVPIGGIALGVLAVASAAVARRLHQSSCRAQGQTSPHRSRHRRHYSSNHRNNCTRLPQVPQKRRATLLARLSAWLLVRLPPHRRASLSPPC